MRRKVLAMLMVLASGLASGCESPECARLKACCNASSDLQGVGDACKLSQSVADPTKCAEIQETLVYMYASKGVDVPAACGPEAK